MTGTIEGQALRHYLMWGTAMRLRIAPSGPPSWLRRQRFRVWVHRWLLECSAKRGW